MFLDARARSTSELPTGTRAARRPNTVESARQRASRKAHDPQDARASVQDLPLSPMTTGNLRTAATSGFV